MGKRLCLILLILLSVSWDSYARQDDPFTSFELQIPANGRYIEYKMGLRFYIWEILLGVCYLD